MDPRGLRARLTGAGCTSCGTAVPVERIAVLADRGDFAFVELDCPACGSRTMGLVLATHADGDPVLDTAAPIDEEDVAAMRRLLGGWTGDLRSLVEGGSDGPAPR